MSRTDEALNILASDPDVVPGAAGFLAERLIEASYQDGAAPMRDALAAMKRDPGFASAFKATTPGGAGAEPSVASMPPPPPPGSLEAIVANYHRFDHGMGLRPLPDGAPAVTPRPMTPAPEQWRPPDDQRAAAASLNRVIQTSMERRSAQGFGLKPID